MTNIELWFHRIWIALLVILCIVLAKGTMQAQEMELNNIELILKQEKEITAIGNLLFESASEITELRNDVNDLTR